MLSFHGCGKYLEFEVAWNDAYLWKLISIEILSWDDGDLDLFDVQIFKLNCWFTIKF